MTTFSDPYGRLDGPQAKRSPDGRWFAVVTTKGLLETNKLESSVWLFSAQQAERFLRAGGERPNLHLLFRRTGTPKALQTSSYGALISNLDWADNSLALFVSVERSDGIRHVLDISVSTGRVVDVLPDARGSVMAAVERGNTRALIEQQVVALQKEPSTSSGNETVLTDQTLLHSVFPELYPDSVSVEFPWKLRVIRNGKAVLYPRPSDTFYPVGAVRRFRPAISADGRYIVTAEPVPELQPSWSAYRSVIDAVRLSPSSYNDNRDGKSYTWPWRYALIDTHTGESRPLLATPTGYATGFVDTTQAVWSPDGAKIALTNTYLPLDSSSRDETNSVKPCAIALYRLANRAIECVTEVAFPERPEHLVSVRFVGASGELVAKWSKQGVTHEVQYVNGNHEWKGTEKSSESPSLNLTVRQDIAVPPTLWAEQGEQKQMLWNPNPQLSGRLLARGSLLTWTDSSNYVWHAALLLPPTPMPVGGYPLVIQTHGLTNPHEFLADGAYTTGFAAMPLACSGIAVLQMEDRTDRHVRPAMEEADDAARGYETAISTLYQKGLIDKSRVGIIGFSRTHWYVEKALERSPHLYKAATLIDGIDQSYVTAILFGPSMVINSRDHEAANGAPPWAGGLSMWLQRAAGFNLDKLTTPLRLEAIGKASVLGEWETYAVLHQLHRAVDFVEIPDGQHILHKPLERYWSQQGDVDWFRFWLQGYERNDAEHKSQYARWKDLQRPSK
ncbi:hypothetical protein ACFQBQ_08100 [Granulicella cerasi]|uniref:Peptidase S9 prolyl oligopeptidase catalytic domain-containing protein n=1 Tax=Granulicella cerasi TaxID=741063 RepID=A0ABW1ZAT7_9BACT|nr:hypothetical protein [Granulicella cerasi]